MTDILEIAGAAHAVRLKWCGGEVEVKGIVSLKTEGCPEDCHFCCSPGGLVDGSRRADRPPLTGQRGRQASRRPSRRSTGP